MSENFIAPKTPGGEPVVVIGKAQSTDGRIRYRVHIPVAQHAAVRDSFKAGDVDNPNGLVKKLSELDITVELDEVSAKGTVLRHTLRTKLVYAGVFGALQRAIEEGVSRIIDGRLEELTGISKG